MNVQDELGPLIDEVVTGLAAATTVMALYGPTHPRTVAGLTTLAAALERALGDEDELAFVLLGDDLFVQERLLGRSSRQAPSLIRRFRRSGIEHLVFRAGVGEGELREFVKDLAVSHDEAVACRPHIVVGAVNLSEVPVSQETEGKGAAFPSVRDRVSLLQETLDAFTRGGALAVADLEKVARTLLALLASDDRPLRHLAAWEEWDRWPAVHAHNTCLLAEALARRAGIGKANCVELGIAALLHDIARAGFPRELLERELDGPGEGEAEFVFEHPAEGFGALVSETRLPLLTVIVTLEHHLAFDGTGFPRLPRPRRPHPVSRMVAIVDAFDTLYTGRGRQRPGTVGPALAWVERRSGTRFDPALVAVLPALVGSPAGDRES